MELIIIVILLLYIIFLQFQLHKKTQYAEGLVQRILDSGQRLEADGVSKAAGEKNQQDSSHEVSNLLEDSVQNFLLEDEPKCKIFIHYTREEEIARKIFSEGFFFVDSFHKTAEAVTNDQTNLVYKHYLHKNYGKYIIVISISKAIFSYYTGEIGKSKKVINVEQLLSEAEPCLNENDDEVYLLPKQFIKGYINLDTGTTIRNPNYNPSFDSPAFLKNINRMER